MLGRVGWRLLAGAASTLAWALAPGRPEPDLALLEGETLAPAGVPSAYRMRVCNPTRASLRLTVLVRGWRDEEAEPAFQVAWDVALGPRASAERWVRSSWDGDASLATDPLSDRAVAWGARAAGRWRVEARIEGRERDALHIAGTFVA
jgi:hypothetical protein